MCVIVCVFVGLMQTVVSPLCSEKQLHSFTKLFHFFKNANTIFLVYAFPCNLLIILFNSSEWNVFLDDNPICKFSQCKPSFRTFGYIYTLHHFAFIIGHNPPSTRTLMSRKSSVYLLCSSKTSLMWKLLCPLLTATNRVLTARSCVIIDGEE